MPGKFQILPGKFQTVPAEFRKVLESVDGKKDNVFPNYNFPKLSGTVPALCRQTDLGTVQEDPATLLPAGSCRVPIGSCLVPAGSCLALKRCVEWADLVRTVQNHLLALRNSGWSIVGPSEAHTDGTRQILKVVFLVSYCLCQQIFRWRYFFLPTEIAGGILFGIVVLIFLNIHSPSLLLLADTWVASVRSSRQHTYKS